MSPINSFLAARAVSSNSASLTSSFNIQASSASAVIAPSASMSGAANAGPSPFNPPGWLGPLIIALVVFVLFFCYIVYRAYRKQCAAAAEAAENSSSPPPPTPPPAYGAAGTLSAEDAVLRITRANTLRNSIPRASIVGAQVLTALPDSTAETSLPPMLRPVGARW
ncbi:hypothetical protein B0H19DRAFT_1256626 [Mycena capillaripes]|nr:hypothetical protein B0H19DRAFT_1256626 [Mycena capillaripes]